MTAEERARVVDGLPTELPRATPQEGDPHRLPIERALEALEDDFRRRGRSVYLSSGLPVYYPEEAMFAPDLLAVVDVPAHDDPDTLDGRVSAVRIVRIAGLPFRERRQ